VPLLAPTAPGQKTLLRIRRHDESFGGRSFQLSIETPHGPVVIMTAKRQATNPKYVILDSKGVNLGDVNSSALGTSFLLFEGEAKEEVAAVIYEPNFLGHNGPRKMNVLIPAMQPDGRRAPPDPLKRGLKQTLSAPSGDQSVVSLFNKVPQWNDETQSFVLNFNGRVSLASVKNFQIVHNMDLEHIALQFGRIAVNEFSLDVQYPFSLLQAFGIALTSFDSKVACE
jgi:hypothetical protein